MSARRRKRSPTNDIEKACCVNNGSFVSSHSSSSIEGGKEKKHDYYVFFHDSGRSGGTSSTKRSPKRNNDAEQLKSIHIRNAILAFGVILLCSCFRKHAFKKFDDSSSHPTSTASTHTRIFVLLHDDNENHKFMLTNRTIIFDPMLQVAYQEKTVEQPTTADKDTAEKCVPMKPWQTKSFPTCNSMHELNIQDWGDRRSPVKGTNVRYKNDQYDIIGNGWFRNTWKVSSASMFETFVFKSLRFERDFLKEYFELHRRESVAMERLNSSPYIIDIYSYCGNSMVNEFADFIQGYQNFRAFAKQLSGNNEDKVLNLKLQIATMIALGVQHIHEIDESMNTTLVHYDLNPMNVVITAGGIPKINDFNLAEFIQWKPDTNERCGFRGRFKEPWWRSPEEMLWNQNKTSDVPLLNEKVDVYSLGNIIYILLTGHSPRGPTKQDRKAHIQQQVLNGVAPALDRFPNVFYSTSEDPRIVAMKQALNECYQPDPTKRSSSRDIANILIKAIVEI